MCAHAGAGGVYDPGVHWHYAILEHAPEDQLVYPLIGPDDPELRLTYAQAHAEVAQLLDRLAQQDQQVQTLVDQWARGARDDTVYIGPRILTLYSCPDGDCAAGYQAWVAEWSQILEAAGLRVEVHQPPGV